MSDRKLTGKGEKVREKMIAATVKILQQEGFKKATVRSIAKTAGVTVAEPLISDGAAPGHESGFEAMIRHNVRVITTALGTK